MLMDFHNNVIRGNNDFMEVYVVEAVEGVHVQM